MKRLKYWIFWIVAIMWLFGFSYGSNYTVYSQSFSETCSDCSVSISDVNSDLVCLVNDNCWYYDFLYNFDHWSRAWIASEIPSEHLFWWLWICSSDVIYYSTVWCKYTVNYITVDIEDILSWNVDTNYCLENNLCPVSDCSWWLSDLFINEIQHPSAPLINITIPEEFDWTYTWDEEEYDVVVNWYNVDTEYIDWIIRNQTTLPDKTDFNKAISELVPLLVPWLVIILFLYFVFRSIKKIF